MGINDLERIHPVYRACVDFCKLCEIPFTFKEDLGSFETAIQFNTIAPNQFKHSHPPTATGWDEKPIIQCPDILDYCNKIIIEFEEESGPPLPGAKLARKGHGHEGDLDTKRDTKRNLHYKDFRVFRLWESMYLTSNWKAKLFQFLLECYEMK